MPTHAIRFRDLHAPGSDILVLANPWSVGSARLLANLGFKALATTSAGMAFHGGFPDGDGAVTRASTFAHCRELLAATDLPLTADLEDGFGATPEAVAETIRQAGELGLAGASIEDATYDPKSPIYERSLAVERVAAAVEAARATPGFVLTARAENLIRAGEGLDDTVWRLKAFEAVGADVLYAPGLPDEQAIRLVCSELTQPVNYVVGVSAQFSLAELSSMGVRRVSIGSSFARASIAGLANAAREVLESGTFAYSAGLPSVPECNAFLTRS